LKLLVSGADVVRIANLDGYTPVIIENEVGDIIAFQEDGTNNFQEDAAIFALA
jgi:hypothetical protein